jgi:hypothetical protein
MGGGLGPSMGYGGGNIPDMQNMQNMQNMQGKGSVSSYATAGGPPGAGGPHAGGFPKPSMGQGMSALNNNMQGLSFSSQNSHEGSPAPGMSPNTLSGLSASGMDPRLMGPPMMNLRQGASDPSGPSHGRPASDYSDYGYGDRS